MISAILWDFGGVLTSSPFREFNDYEQAKGLPKDFIRGLNARNYESNAWARFERNEIDLDEFDRLFFAESAALGQGVSGKEVVTLLGGDLRPEMVEALRRCNERFPSACITNNINVGEGPGMYVTHERAQAVREVFKLFKVVVESSKVGMRKPDPRIYRVTCDKLGVDPSEVVYLDDLGVNLKPARNMGMKTIKVGEPAIALTELEAMLGMALR